MTLRSAVTWLLGHPERSLQALALALGILGATIAVVALFPAAVVGGILAIGAASAVALGAWALADGGGGR